MYMKIEKLRRIFYRWLGHARQARHKRLLLEEKEHEFRLNRMEDAWEMWKEKFQDRRLQPLADQYAITRETGLVFRAFGIWHAKTKVNVDVVILFPNADSDVFVHSHYPLFISITRI